MTRAMSAKAAIADLFATERAKERAWKLSVVAVVLSLAYLTKDFRWHVVWDSGPFILKGLATSWILALWSMALGGLIAVPLAVARVYGPRGVKHLAVGLIELVRATPELMVVFWVYFMYPRFAKAMNPLLPTFLGIDPDLTPWTSGLAAMTVIAAVYLAEVVRAGLFSVPKEQWEAGRASGLGGLRVFVHIVLPQALRNMVPALVAQFVMLFKTTSLVYVVGVIEFFRAIILVNSAEFAPYALYTTMGVGYFVCCSALAWVVRKLDPNYVLIE